jgi:integrase
LGSVETDLKRGQWIDPKAGQVTLEKYTGRWLGNRSNLANSTRQTYDDLLRRHIVPAFGGLELASVEPSAVRGWWAELSERHPSTAAKAYRLLNSIYRTAIDDGIVGRNPCKVKGGGNENTPERPVATVAQVAALADAMPEPLRCIVLLAAWCGLRSGELTALRRKDLDVLGGFVNVRESMEQLHDGTVNFKPPKTKAGRRRIAIPGNITEELAGHLAAHVEPPPEALVFTTKQVARYATTSFMAIGTRHGRPLVCRNCTSTTFATRRTPGPRPPGPVPVS